MVGIIIGIIAAVIVLGGVVPILIISNKVYNYLLVRQGPDKWGRASNFPEDEEYSGMFAESVKWREDNLDKATEVTITNDGLKLVGEYYDFGYDKAVIIVAGRPESLLYSGFFAPPYVAAGYNVFIFDNRATGLSEGDRSAVGQKEYRDVLAWAKLVYARFNIDKIFLHGVCVGSSCALFAASDNNVPDYIVGMAAEGMYYSFYESTRTHMIYDHRPLYPFLWFITMWVRLKSGVDIWHDGPYKRLPKLNKPILFLHSKADCFSYPRKLEEMLPSVKAPYRVEWFEDAFHSRIRYVHREQYDNTIAKFLEEYIG